MTLKINDTKINWTSSDSHYFFNPKHPEAQKWKKLSKKLPFLPGHLYLFTSGGGKICLLSKEAFLASARAVNKNLQSQTRDRWLIALPLFHVARSFCGACSFFKSPAVWNAKSFQKKLEEKKISLCSLVPTQVYDLVQQNLKAPKTLRAVIVGGDSLSPFLYGKARKLGWPILISYGLTETASQIACSDLSSLNKKSFPEMKLLNHVKIKQLQTKTKLKSKSLLSAYFDIQTKKLHDPKDSRSWWELPDKVSLKKDQLIVKGRKEEEIKISGERVDLQKLSFLMEELSKDLPGDHHLTAVPDTRKGFQMALTTTEFDFSKSLSLIKRFNTKVAPFEKIKAVYCVPEFERSTLFKVRQKHLRKQLGFYTDLV